MCRAETAISIKQNKKQKQRGVHLYKKRVIVLCLIMAQKQRLINIPSKAAYKLMGKRKQEKENLWAGRWRKEKKDEHLKFLTMPRSILF